MNARTSWSVIALFLLVTTVGCSRAEHGMNAQVAAAAEAPPAPSADRAHTAAGSMREVHVVLELDMASAEAARDALTKLGDVTRAADGFVQLTSFGANDTRSHLVLRVPPASLPALRAACAGAGALARDEETQVDVTDAIADLDARLRAARTEESRLLALVAERTGTVGDVLAAERALADVRDRIERVDAESRASHGRVDLATVDVWLAHPVRGQGEGTIATRLATAAKDGVSAAGVVTLGAATMTLRAGPTMAIFALLGAIAVVIARRRRVPRVSPAA
jgi:hypothetical protein